MISSVCSMCHCESFRIAPEGLAISINGKTILVYILTNLRNTVLYIGMTNDLIRRVYQHKNKLVEGFTKRYNVDRLFYFEAGGEVGGVIDREKQLKAGTRLKKIQLIESMNPEWRDLWEHIKEGQLVEIATPHDFILGKG